MISLLLVNFRSASLAMNAIASARAATTTQPLQVVAVDNSCDPREVDALRPHADVVIASPRNRGYAGAINDARAACEGGTIVICNPDVVFGAGSIDALHAALDERTAVAGPALFWDARYRWFLPPAELHSGRDVLGEAIASRSRAVQRIRDRRRIRHRIEFWSLDGVTEVRAISGAIMAVKTSAFDMAGGFDERFFLYFEEDDFLRRIAEHGMRIVYVPAARCRHLYNQSAGSSAEAPALYASSERRYLEKWNGPFAARVLERLRRPPAHVSYEEMEAPLLLTRTDVVVEASPLSSFETAAGHFPVTATVDLPDDVRAAYRDEIVYLRVVQRDTGRVLAAYRRRAGD